MHCLIICGSHSQSAQSTLVGRFIEKIGAKLIPGLAFEVLCLADYDSLLHHYGAGSPDKFSPKLKADKESLLNKLYKTDAVVLVTPEWGGMITPLMSNMLLLCARGSAGGFPLAHKPGFAVGVSEGEGGTYPISVLKGFCGKNSQICWLPSHLIVKNVRRFLKQSWAPEKRGTHHCVQSRLLMGLKTLEIYARQLKRVRKVLVELSEAHPYGQ